MSGDLEQGWLRVTINVDCGPEPDRQFRVWSPNMPGVLTDAVFRKGVIEAIQFFVENYRRISASASASAPS